MIDSGRIRDQRDELLKEASKREPVTCERCLGTGHQRNTKLPCPSCKGKGEF